MWPFEVVGSASNRAALPDLAAWLFSAALTRYPHQLYSTAILAVYAADDRARHYLSSFNRVKIIPPPDHDLSDYYRAGYNLHAWLASFLVTTTQSTVAFVG